MRRPVAGEGLPKIAAELGRPYSTAWDWRRRHREAAAESLAPDLAERAESQDWAALAAAIQRVLNGERDEDALAAGLDAIDRAILHQILVGIANPAGGRAVDG